MRLDDGFPTTIRFSENPSVKFWEKSVKPPAIQGGGANSTTTMRNIRMRTKAPKKLLDTGDMTGTVAYDPLVYDEIDDMIQVNQLIWIEWPDGSALKVWGWLDEFDPGDVAEGEQPEAEITVIISNQNNENPPEEVKPAHDTDGYS